MYRIPIDLQLVVLGLLPPPSFLFVLWFFFLPSFFLSFFRFVISSLSSSNLGVYLLSFIFFFPLAFNNTDIIAIEDF